jgi:hypothetical protein
MVAGGGFRITEGRSGGGHLAAGEWRAKIARAGPGGDSGKGLP